MKPIFSTPFTMIELLDKGHHAAVDGKVSRLHAIKAELLSHHGIEATDEELRERLCTCIDCFIEKVRRG